MATGMDDMYKSLEEFERELTCGVCLEHYTEPKVLPCLHYYCKKCIIQMALKNNPFNCPECCKEIEVISCEEDKLPPAHFINRLGELFSKQKKALSKEVACEICTDSCATAEGFCKQCSKFVCADCIKSHSKMKAVFEGHQIISVSEVRQVGTDELVPPPVKRCKTHNEQQKMYCFQCKSLICQDCVFIDHKNHKIEFSTKVASSHRESLTEKTKILKELKLKLSEGVKEVQSTAEEVQAQGSDVAKNIEASFEELQRILLERKAQLLGEVEHRVREKMANLKKQEENLNEANSEVQSIVDYTEQCVKYCGDDELITMFSDIYSQIQARIDSLQGEAVSLKPVEEVDICANTDCSKKLQEVCSKNTQIGKIPIKLSLLTTIPDQVILNVEHTLTVAVALANGKQLKGNPIVKSEIKSGCLVDKNTVKEVECGKYAITYTPKYLSSNELLVFVHHNGRKFESSFPIKVCMSHWVSPSLRPFGM